MKNINQSIKSLFISTILMTAMTFTISAQEIVNELFIRGINGSATKFKLFDRVYNDNGRIYFEIRIDSTFNDKLESDNFMDLDFDLEPEGRDYIFEYKPGVGVVDYTILKNKYFWDNYSIDGDYMALTSGSYDNAINGHAIPLDDDQPNPGDNLVVYDLINDTILWYYEDTLWDQQQFYIWDEICIEGDFLYYATTYWDIHVFMGDTLDNLYPEYGQHQYSTMLHKINWRTNEKLWSKHMEGEEKPERVRDIKVIDDGTLMIAIEISRPFGFDGEVYDPPHFINGGGTGPESNYNMVVAKISQDGEYINHIHIKAEGDQAIKDVKLEDTGEVYAYGSLRPSTYVEFENDTITFDRITNYAVHGIFFAFDKNLDLQYYKKYESNNTVWVTAAGYISNENIGVNIYMRDSVTIEDQVYHTMYQDPDGNFGVNESLLVVFDMEGNIVRDPIRFGKEQRIRDIIELDEEHYLIAVTGRSRTNIEGPLFLGEDITYTTNETIFYDNYAQIIEVKGPLFDVVSSINETLSNHEFEIYPNVCASNTAINIELPSAVRGSSMLKILDLKGSQLYSERITATNNLHHLTLPDMESGTKIVVIESNGEVYKSILIIIN